MTYVEGGINSVGPDEGYSNHVNISLRTYSNTAVLYFTYSNRAT